MFVKNETAPAFQDLAIYSLNFGGTPLKTKIGEDSVRGVAKVFAQAVSEPNLIGKIK